MANRLILEVLGISVEQEISVSCLRSALACEPAG